MQPRILLVPKVAWGSSLAPERIARCRGTVCWWEWTERALLQPDTGMEVVDVRRSMQGVSANRVRW